MVATRILFFGFLKEAARGPERLVDLPAEVSNGALLVEWLAADDDNLHAALTRPGVRLCVDQSIAPVDARFDQPSEIAFLPAFSGG